MKKISTLFAITVSTLLLISAQLASAQGNSNGNGNGNGIGNGNAMANNGKNKNIGVGNASDGIKGHIVTARDIFYTGDPLAISIQFPRGAELIEADEAEAYVVVFAPTVPGDDDSDTSDGDSDDSSNDGADDGSDDNSDDGADNSSDDGSDTSTGDTAGTDDELTDAVVLPVSSEASTDKRQLFAIDAVDVSTLPAGTYQLGLILTNPDGNPLNINDWYNGLLGLIDVVGLTVSEEAVDFDSDGDGEVDDDMDDDGFSDDEEEEEDEEEGSEENDGEETTP